METISNNLFCLLSQCANIPKKIDYIHDEYNEQYNEILLSKLCCACELLPYEFDNIKKSYINGICHMTFCTDMLLNKNDEINEIFFSNLKNNAYYDDIFDLTNILTYICEHSKLYKKISCENIFPNNESVLHFVCKNNFSYEIMQKILKNKKIKLNSVNMNGKTPYDILCDRCTCKNASDVTKLFYNCSMTKLNKKISKLELLNKQLEKKNLKNNETKIYTMFAIFICILANIFQYISTKF